MTEGEGVRSAAMAGAVGCVCFVIEREETGCPPAIVAGAVQTSEPSGPGGQGWPAALVVACDWPHLLCERRGRLHTALSAYAVLTASVWLLRCCIHTPLKAVGTASYG